MVLTGICLAGRALAEVRIKLVAPLRGSIAIRPLGSGQTRQSEAISAIEAPGAASSTRRDQIRQSNRRGEYSQQAGKSPVSSLGFLWRQLSICRDGPRHFDPGVSFIISPHPRLSRAEGRYRSPMRSCSYIGPGPSVNVHSTNFIPRSAGLKPSGNFEDLSYKAPLKIAPSKRHPERSAPCS